MLGQVKGSRKRGELNIRGIDSVREVTVLSLQDLRKAINYSIFWRALIHRVAMKWRWLADKKHVLWECNHDMCSFCFMWRKQHKCFPLQYAKNRTLKFWRHGFMHAKGGWAWGKNVLPSSCKRVTAHTERIMNNAHSSYIWLVCPDWKSEKVYWYRTY